MDKVFTILLIILVSGVSYFIPDFAKPDIILFPASSSITALVATLKPASYPSSTLKSIGQIVQPLCLSTHQSPSSLSVPIFDLIYSNFSIYAY